MRETINLLDPTSEQSPARRVRLAPPESLDGLTVALLDISKPRGDVFLDRIEQRLTELTGRGLTVKRYMKPTVMKTAPQPIVDAIVDECDLVVEALAD